MSRGQLLEQVVGFAATLRANGVKPQDVVNIADTNTVWKASNITASFQWPPFKQRPAPHATLAFCPAPCCPHPRYMDFF